MKNFKYIVFLLFTLFLFNQKVFAEDDYYSYASGDAVIRDNNNFNVLFGINSTKKISGILANIVFDKNKLELVSYNGLNGFNAVINDNKAVFDNVTSFTGRNNIVSLLFKPKDTFKVGETTTITFEPIEVGNENNELLNGNKVSYLILKKKPFDTNNNLKSLEISNIDFKFNTNTTTYNFNVENEVKEIEIKATSESSSAKISGVGIYKLKDYKNKIIVKVTSENGDNRNYTININRKDENGNLENIKKEENEKLTLIDLSINGYEINFNSEKYQYNINIENDVDDLDINYDVEDNIMVDVNKPKELVVGENVITINLANKEGLKATYTIEVFKKEITKNENQNCVCPRVSNNNLIFKIIITVETLVIGSLLIYIVLKKKRKVEFLG